MLLKRAALEKMAEGSVDLAFRRWKRPTVRSGGTLTTAVGVFDILDVRAVDEASISTKDAIRAGFLTAAEVHDSMRGREGSLYRIQMRYRGPDPRAALRALGDPSPRELEELEDQLRRLDKKRPWTRVILEWIRDNPEVRAPELAASLNRDTKSVKADVRKLKALGLTESLRVGYRLSPRGMAYVARTQPGRGD